MFLFKKNVKVKKTELHFEGYNEEMKRQKSKHVVVIGRRMTYTIFFVLSFALVLLLRLAYIQFEQGDIYKTKLLKYSTSDYTISVARGEMYDRDGVLLVGNKTVLTAVYYPPKNIKRSEMLVMAEFISQNITGIDLSRLTLRDKKDYYILMYPDEADQLITEEEYQQYLLGDLTDNDYYRLQLERIDEELINHTFDDKGLLKAKVYYSMVNAYGKPVSLLTDLTQEQASLLAENTSFLRGIKISTDWEREYANQTLFRQVFGSVSSSSQGLMAEYATEMLAQGYALNDRVGRSGLEQQYDQLLRGIDSSYTISYDQQGNPLIYKTEEGTTGINLKLTIDWELQEYVSQLIEDKLLSIKDLSGNKYVSKMFIVMMDPNNGDIVVMAGKYYDRESGEMIDYAAGTYLEAFEIGSTSKGATIYTAYKYGLIDVGEDILDAPIYIRGTAVKSSYVNMGIINDVEALAQSSNVYMFHIAMRLGGTTYTPYAALDIDYTAFDKLRESFGELGLGVKTGIDLPKEELGYKGSAQTAGLLLDAAIGQYDTYTTLQLAQYTSTLANGGYRLRPRLVSEGFIYDDEGNEITVFKNEPEVLDDVSANEIAFERVRLGFRQGVTHGIVTTLRGAWYLPAGKTGTADVYDYSTNINYPNKLLIAFAPYTNPKITYACVTPRISTTNACSQLAPYIFEKYFEKYGIE